MTPIEKLEKKHKQERKALQELCEHPKEHRKKTYAYTWHDWPDYGKEPGRVFCTLCNKTLAEVWESEPIKKPKPKKDYECQRQNGLSCQRRGCSYFEWGKPRQCGGVWADGTPLVENCRFYKAISV